MSVSTLKGYLVDVELWAPVEEVESAALTQLRNITSLPQVYHHVAAMADCHLGKGATVGSVVAMDGAVIPAAVGVDIGCGMGAIKTTLKASDLPDSLGAIRSRIEDLIPVGFAGHKRSFNPIIRYPGTNPVPHKDAVTLEKDLKTLWSEFKNLHSGVQDLESKAKSQLGSLGGGNHFIELCLDTDDDPNVWMMLHSGSRNIGKSLAEIHMGIAKKLTHNEKIIDRDLATFLAGTPEMAAYRRDLYWAQRYALLNRRVMFELYKKALREFFPKVEFGDPILCHHNYVAEETHFGKSVFVTRKGAINAESGTLGIIPGSMGTKSYIVRGKGNADSFNSASHGAGRRMSRGEAKRVFTEQDLAEQTKGVECRKDLGVLDEIPGAYKDIDQVMANQQDLVEVVAELKQVLCVKG